MSIEVTCVECGTSHQVNDRLAGRRVRCSSCDGVVHVPEEAVGVEAEAVEVEAVEVEAVEVEAVEVEALVSDSSSSVSDDAEGLRSQAVTRSFETQSLIDMDDDDEDEEAVLPRSERPQEDVDMTPMVDVTFLLLIFFVVTAAFSLQKSIRMPRQQTDAPSSAPVEIEQDDVDMVEVQVDEFGSFLVMAPDWERETLGKHNLLNALKEAIAGRNEGMRLQVKVHEMAKLRSLVDVMDAGTIAGYTPLEVLQVEEFD